jgi:hypothetical protein
MNMKQLGELTPQKLIVGLVAVGLMVLGVLSLLGTSARLTDASGSLNLPPADTPPLEYAYLDSGRVDAYLGQAENGLASSEQRAQQVTRSVNASLAAGASAQLGASQQAQESATATVAPKAADRFYTFLRLLRNEDEASYGDPGTCNRGARTHWLGEINYQASPEEIMKQVACVGVGNFVRIINAQLFLPPFAQALPRAQSVNAFYGALPAPRTAFTSPTQSVQISHALSAYAKLVGTRVRMPFVGAPYGVDNQVGRNVAFFLPAEYQGLGFEPSLFSGSVTIVGKILYSARAGEPYIDYPTISTFGRALLHAQPAFRDDLGVCSPTPPAATRPRSPAPQHVALAGLSKPSSCTSDQRLLYDIKKSVTFKPPFVVVLPLAIYQ